MFTFLFTLIYEKIVFFLLPLSWFSFLLKHGQIIFKHDTQGWTDNRELWNHYLFKPAATSNPFVLVFPKRKIEPLLFFFFYYGFLQIQIVFFRLRRFSSKILWKLFFANFSLKIIYIYGINVGLSSCVTGFVRDTTQKL